MVKYTASMKVYLLVLLLVVWVEQAVVDAANVGGNCTLPIVQHGFFVHLNPGGQNIIQHNRIAYISCQEGYSLDGPPEIICRHGSWSTDIPVCKPKECSMVSVPNGIITSNSSSTEPISHKSYIYINCSQGYVLEGISSLFCNFGKWSSDIPSCVPMPCETTQVRNGILIHEGGIVRTSMKIRHQDSVMVSCRTGYILSSQFSQVSCLLGKWSHPFPTCMPEPCTPHKVLNGRVLYSGRDVSSDTEVQDSHTATIVCDPDYILHGDSGLTCHKGQWSADFPSCLPKFCSSELVLQGQVIYNGQVLQDITKVQHRSSVYINCKAGYVNVGSTKVTCTYGHWSNYFPTCLPKSCHAQTVLHGTVKYLEHQLTNVCSTLSGGLVSHSHAVSVECLPGFLLEGTDILSCKFGNWSDAFPKCQPASCRVEGVENGGTVDEEEMEVVVAAHGKEVTVVCNDGYRLPRDRPLDKIKCYYGQWTYSFPACVPENCSANSVLNGQVVYNNSVVDFNVLNPRPLQVPHKQHVQINCMPGFNMTERSRIMCVSGKWSHQFPTCYPNSCQANPVENGVTRVVEENSLLRDWGQLVSHGLSVNISCKVGHELSGSDHLKCLYGNWTGDFPTCTPKSCLVKKVKNGQESYHDDTITSFVKHNMFVHISCDDGYSLVGASKIKCSEGYWCSALPTCEPKQCQVNEVPNSSIKVNGKKLVVYDKPAAHLSIAVVTCRRGYNLNGIPRVQCLFGKWSSEFPTCEGLVCEAPSISNGRLKDVSTNEIVPAGTTIEANVSLTVECDTDYTLQGEPGVTQCDMAKWTNVFPTCEKNIYCEKFKGDFEMLVTYSGPLSKGAIAKFECRNVYCFKTNDEIAVCGSDGKWQIGDVPKFGCNKLRNSKYMKVSLTVSEGIPEMSISCNKETHTPADNVTTVLCLNDKWLPFSPKCKPNSCKVPDLARGIYRTTADGRIPPGSEIEHGQTIYAKCESGYRTESNFYFTTCKYGQLKNIDRIACKEKGCKPPRPTNGVFEPRISDTEDSLWIAGSQVSVMCQDGFTPNNGIGAATCLRGSWQPYQPSCIPKYCEVPMVENGYFLYGNHKKIVDHHIKNGTSIKILCESNHNATGPNTVLCSYGHWLPATPACQKYSCLPLQNSTTSPLVLLQDSHPQTTTTTSRTLMVADSGFEPVYHGLYYAHGTTVRLVCDLSKYKPRNGVTTSTCFDGRWTVKDLRCQPLPCLPPKNDSHSPLSLIGAPTPLLLHSTVVQLHCDRRKSFPLDNNVQAVCQYGQWTPTHLQCIPRPCVLPEFRETTYLYLNAEPVKNYTVASGVYIHVVCDKPHLVPTVALCHYGSWYLPIRSCFDGSCYLSEKETIDSWTDTISGETSVRSYTHNSTSIRISCKRNYRLRNETNRFTCLEGQWKPFEPYCEEDPVVSNLVPGTRPVCRHPEQGDNVVFVWDSVSPKDFGNNIIADGTSFHAHCSDVGNFQLMGSDFLSCHNGIWYGRLPVCQKTEEDELAPPRIYINVSTSWSSEREQYMVTANGSVVISPGDRLQLGCAHNLYSPTDLEWVPPNESVPVPEYTSENIALNVTGIRLHISHFTARNAGQYICRIKNTSLHHFVWFVIL